MHESVDPKVPTIVYPIEFPYPELTKGKVFMSELSSYALLILIKGQNISEILSGKNSKMIIIMVGKGSLVLYCQCDRCSLESEIRGDSYQSGGRGRWTQSWFRHLLSRMWWKHYFRKKETDKETIYFLSLCINCLLGNYSSSKSQRPWFLDDLTWYARRNIWYENWFLSRQA